MSIAIYRNRHLQLWHPICSYYAESKNKVILHLSLLMVIQELEKQLLQLSPNDKLYIIQLLAQSLTQHNNNISSNQPNKLSEFFRQSPLAELTEELDLSRDMGLPRNAFTPNGMGEL